MTVRYTRPHSLWLYGCFLSSDLWCPQAEVRGPPWAYQQRQQWPIQPHQQHTGDDKQTLWPYCAQEGEQKSPVSAHCVCVRCVFVCVGQGEACLYVGSEGRLYMLCIFNNLTINHVHSGMYCMIWLCIISYYIYCISTIHTTTWLRLHVHSFSWNYLS